jgi:hypothetical protein
MELISDIYMIVSGALLLYIGSFCEVHRRNAKVSANSASQNKPMPFAPPIFEDGIAVVESDYLPKRTIMASRDLYAQFKQLPDGSSKTAA